MASISSGISADVFFVLFRGRHIHCPSNVNSWADLSIWVVVVVVVLQGVKAVRDLTDNLN
jgi:hypothetical protein